MFAISGIEYLSVNSMTIFLNSSVRLIMVFSAIFATCGEILLTMKFHTRVAVSILYLTVQIIHFQAIKLMELNFMKKVIPDSKDADDILQMLRSGLGVAL